MSCTSCNKPFPEGSTKLVCFCTSPPTVTIHPERQKALDLSAMMEEIGPGTILSRKLLAVKFFLTILGKTCKCKAIAADMNKYGPRGCEVRMEEILDRISESASLADMSNIFDRDRARKLVQSSIDKSRKAIPKHRYSYAYQE